MFVGYWREHISPHIHQKTKTKQTNLEIKQMCNMYAASGHITPQIPPSFAANLENPSEWKRNLIKPRSCLLTGDGGGFGRGNDIVA